MGWSTWEFVSTQIKCVLKQKNPCVVALQLLYLYAPEVKQCWRNQMQVDVIFKLASVIQPVLSPLLNIISFPGRTCEVAASRNCPWIPGLFSGVHESAALFLLMSVQGCCFQMKNTALLSESSAFFPSTVHEVIFNYGKTALICHSDAIFSANFFLQNVW